MSIQINGLELPLIKQKNINVDISSVIRSSLEEEKIEVESEDILVVSSSIISKFEGRSIKLDKVYPSESAKHLSDLTGKDPRICELVIREGEILGVVNRAIITEYQGRICANAGIDISNVEGSKVLLPPVNPNRTSERILSNLDVRGVVISDSVGRPFRKGAIGTAIGYAGIAPLISYEGKKDLFGRELESTLECVADEIASAANLVFGESNRGIPVAIIKNLDIDGIEVSEKIVREKEKCVFECSDNLW